MCLKLSHRTTSFSGGVQQHWPPKMELLQHWFPQSGPGSWQSRGPRCSGRPSCWSSFPSQCSRILPLWPGHTRRSACLEISVKIFCVSTDQTHLTRELLSVFVSCCSDVIVRSHFLLPTPGVQEVLNVSHDGLGFTVDQWPVSRWITAVGVCTVIIHNNHRGISFLPQ